MPAEITRTLFTLLVVAVAANRLAELSRSRRNARELLERGGVEHGRGHLGPMVALHAAFLAAAPAEVWALAPRFRPPLAAAAGAVFVAAHLLRVWAITTLGERWTVRVIVLPGEPVVRAGPYRYLRHPNYVGVVLEIATLPLIHGAWVTSLVFSALNALLLRTRIRVEDAALSRAAGAADA